MYELMKDNKQTCFWWK